VGSGVGGPESFFFRAVGCIGLEQGLAKALVEVGVVLEAVVEVGVDELQGGWRLVIVVPDSAAHDVIDPLRINGTELAIAVGDEVADAVCGEVNAFAKEPCSFIDCGNGCRLRHSDGQNLRLAAGVIESNGVGPTGSDAGAFHLHDVTAELFDVLDDGEKVFAGIGCPPLSGANGGEGDCIV